MTVAPSGSLLALDARHVWHPYTQHWQAPAPVPVQTMMMSVSGSSGIRKVAPNGPTTSTLSPWRRSHSQLEATPRKPGISTRFTVMARLLVFGRSPSRALATE